MSGGYICHLDATCEGRDPFLMSSIDSLSDIVLGNIKLPSEDQTHIVPFLKRIKKAFGVPLALVHDMGKGILAAVARVFPDVPDFICHFHFLRDIGKDFLGAEYDTIRKRLARHGISAALRCRAKQFKAEMDTNPAMIKALQEAMANGALAPQTFEFAPVVGAYTLIQWALKGKTDGDGYGFPFDRPHLSFAQRLRHLNVQIERIKDIHLRGQWRDNDPYFKIHIALKPVIKDRTLWKGIDAIEAKIAVFEKLRKAMRIALPAGSHGLNDEGRKGNIRTIETRVGKFRNAVVQRKSYAHDPDAQKMIKQIDKYWDKLFADPITVQTPSGPLLIQPQRTNNILEQFFRSLKRANRRRTGNASSSRVLRTMLADTPLVRNLDNPSYMKILLNGKASLEAVFANIEINALREELRKAQDAPERIPAELKPIIAILDFPEKLVKMSENAVA
ncbi:MAG: transposase [Verrucomicrobiota bacterium]